MLPSPYLWSSLSSSRPACLHNMASISPSSATSCYRPILKLYVILQLLHTRGSTLSTQAELTDRRPARRYIQVPLPQPCPDIQRPGCPSFLIAPLSVCLTTAVALIQRDAHDRHGSAPANNDGDHSGSATQQLLTAHKWQVDASPMDNTSGCSCVSVITTRISQTGRSHPCQCASDAIEA